VGSYSGGGYTAILYDRAGYSGAWTTFGAGDRDFGNDEIGHDQASSVKIESNSSCPTGEYQAEYYNNHTLSGSPTFTRCESSINYDWGSGSPGNGLGVDNFSVRWTGHLPFSADTYTFVARADDGTHLWVDGGRIIDAWRDQPPTEYRATRSLTAGEHEVKVEYYENGGGAVAQVGW
jgi:hypothetical protein